MSYRPEWIMAAAGFCMYSVLVGLPSLLPPIVPKKKREEKGQKTKDKGKQAAWPVLALKFGLLARPGGGLAGGEAAAALSLRRGGRGGDLHHLVACLAP